MNLTDLVHRAILEDVGQGDITSLACIPTSQNCTAQIIAKQDLVVCGHDVAKEVFRQRGATYTADVLEGACVSKGRVISTITGNTISILTGERLALNFLMRLCGIATKTHDITSQLKGNLRVVDTRKTTPLLRELERNAVCIGGGMNHRFALYDGILIKENHILAAGGIEQAIQRCRKKAHHLLKIEIEIEHIEQLQSALEAGADVIMLDNMSNDMLRQAVEIRNRFDQGQRVLLEASGNMTKERILEMEDIGIDIVSMGGLIHQATWSDLSLKIRSVH